MKRAPLSILFLVLCGSGNMINGAAYRSHVQGGQSSAVNPQASYLTVNREDDLVSAVNPQASYLTQNIFDDESSDIPEKPAGSIEKLPKKPAADAKAENSDPKISAKAKKKRKGRRKKKAAPAQAAKPGYSTAEIARSSYDWAPETETVMLLSNAPGLKNTDIGPQTKPAQTNARPDTLETKPPAQGFKLPQIPLAQVLIVAGFVLLFLIYRFRVGKQIKRKRY